MQNKTDENAGPGQAGIFNDNFVSTATMKLQSSSVEVAGRYASPRCYGVVMLLVSVSPLIQLAVTFSCCFCCIQQNGRPTLFAFYNGCGMHLG